MYLCVCCVFVAIYEVLFYCDAVQGAQFFMDSQVANGTRCEGICTYISDIKVIYIRRYNLQQGPLATCAYSY